MPNEVFGQVKSATDAMRTPTAPAAYVDVFAPDYKPLPGPLARGFKSQLKGAKAAAGGVAALAGEVTGIDALKQYGLGVSQQAGAEAAELAMPVEEVDSIGSGVDFAKYALGYGGGSLLTMLATGGLGRAGGATLARGVPAAAEKLLLKNAGAAAGVTGGILAQEVGAIYPDAVETGVPDPVARSILGGSAATALDLVGPAVAARKLGMFGKTAAKPGVRTTGEIARGAGKGAAVQVGIEAPTEVAQTAIERASAGRDVTGEEAISEYLNAAALAAVPGAVTGGVAGGVQASRPGVTPATQPIQPAAQPIQPAAQPVQPAAQPAQQQPAAVDAPTAFQATPASALEVVQEPDRLALQDTSPAPITQAERDLIAVQDRRKAIAAALPTLDAEEKLPKADRRPKQEITSERRALQAEATALVQRESNLKTLAAGPEYQPKGSLSEPVVIGEQPAPTPVQEIITPEQDAMMRQAERKTATRQARGAQSVETQLALTKKSRGLLLSSDEAKAVRAYEATAPKIEVAKSSSRGVVKQPGGTQARDNFVNAYTAGVEKTVADLGAQVDMTPTKLASIKSALNRAAERAVQEDTPEKAQQVLSAGFEAAMKGKLPKQDIDTFAQKLTEAVTAAAPEIVQRNFSQAALVPSDKVVFSHWGTVPGGVTDPAKIGTGVSGVDQAAAKAVGLSYTSAVVRGSAYSEPAVTSRTPFVGQLSADKVYQADRNDPLLAQARTEIMQQFGPDENIAWMQYAKKVRDLGYDAIQYANGQLRVFTGQQVYAAPRASEIKKAASVAVSLHSEFGGSSYNVVTGQNLAGTNNYAVSPYSDRELIVPGKDVPTDVFEKFISANEDLLGDPRNILGSWFNEQDGNTYIDVSVVTESYSEAMRIAESANQIAIFNLRTFEEIATGTPPTDVMSSRAAQRFHGIMAHKGVQMLEALESIVGTPARLTAKVVTRVEGGTGVAKFSPAYDIIELSIHAKDGTSLAAHEGYHYLETRVLTPTDNAVVQRMFKRGAPMHKALMTKAREYDQANGTNISSEIMGSLRESTAYGFEFWHRGEFTVDGALARIWQKIAQVMERVSNMIHGLGFQSHEDIFTAIKAGAYARQEVKGLSSYAQPAFSKAADEQIKPYVRYELYDRQTGEVVGGPYKNRKTARVWQDKRDNAHGSYRYGVREVNDDPNAGTLYSQAATDASLADMAQLAAAGEIPRTELNIRIAEMLDDKTIPSGLRDKFIDPATDELRGYGGSAKRFLAENISSGQHLSRKSLGYKNVFGTLTSYVQRKNVLIADAVEKRLSTWMTGASKQDKVAVSAALLTRTENAWTNTSDEYMALRSGLTDNQRAMFDQATEMINSRLDAELAAETITYRKLLEDDAAYSEWYANRYAQVERLKAEGYFPERRFGDHVVHAYVVTPDGKKVTAYFAQHEREADARRELDELNRVAGDQGLTFEYGYRYKADFDGSISFGQFLTTAERVGVNLTQPEKERIAKALVSADSTRRNRIFRRQNIAGYSQDGMRILAEFGVTMANKIAYAELGDAINDAMAGRQVDVTFNNRGEVQINTQADTNMWEQDGENAGFYRSTADRTVEFVLSPRQGSSVSSGLSAAATVHFLGGSIAAGMVNMTSIPMNTVPWLTQHTSYTDAMGKALGAMKTAAANFNAIRDLPTLLDNTIRLDGIDEVEGLRHALQVAAQDGTILETEIYQIMGLSRGQEYSFTGTTQKAVRLWMAPFRLAEQMNRMTSFIAAYKVAKEKNLSNDDAYAMAQDTVYSTQFRYDDANRPGLARGDIGSLLFVFKSYPIFVLETMSFLAKENPRAAAFMLGSIVLMAGVQGVPFAEDMEDLIDTIAQRVFGSSFNTQRWLRNTLKTASEAAVGADLSSVFMHGAANTLTELNFASRVGLGNLIPGTRIGTADADYKGVMTEIIGPVGTLVGGALGGVDALNRGQFTEAARKALPLGAQNFIKGAQSWNNGFATDVGGRKLVDVGGWESFWQSLGFSSAAVSDAYTADRIDDQTKAFYNQARRGFQSEIVKAIQSEDTGRIREATEAVAAWNQANPDMIISISSASIRRQIAQAGMTVNQRTMLKLPKQLRAQSEAALGVEE